jgi:hypothetical protein
VKYLLLLPFNDGGNDDHYGYHTNRDVYVCLTFIKDRISSNSNSSNSNSNSSNSSNQVIDPLFTTRKSM